MAEPQKSEPQAPLFRQVSLERLSSPERLDELMRLVSPRQWLPVGTIAVILGLGLIWSIVGRIPVTTRGQGLLVQSQELGHLVALLYFEPRYRGHIQPGMTIKLRPETFQGASADPLTAQVHTVDAPADLSLETARQQANAGNSPQLGPVEVVAALSEAMPDMAEMGEMSEDSIAPGVAVEGRLILAERAPITYVLPFLNR
ncbi:MAG: hypothetical protein ACFCVD_07375 [Nodosilinea sp.]